VGLSTQNGSNGSREEKKGREGGKGKKGKKVQEPRARTGTNQVRHLFLSKAGEEKKKKKRRGGGRGEKQGARAPPAVIEPEDLARAFLLRNGTDREKEKTTMERQPKGQ